MNRPTMTLFLLFALVLTLAPALAADELPERLSLEWIHSDAPREYGRAASYSWIGESTLLRYDRTLDKGERTLEMIDPATGKVTARVDREKALASLAELLGKKPEKGDKGEDDKGEDDKGEDDEGEDDEAEELGRPLATTDDGRLGLYRREGDYFLLDFESSTFRRVTSGAPAGESFRLSPDASKLGLVRDNDLYVIDVESGEEKRLTHDGSETLLNGTLSWVYWEELFGRRDRGYEFSPDGERIAFLQFDDSPVDVMTFVDPKPDATRVVRQRYPKAGTTNPRVRAGVVDVESGKTTWIDLGAYPYEYLARLVWVDGQRLVVETLDRAQQNLDLFLADASTGAVRHLFRESDDAWVDVHDDLVFLETEVEKEVESEAQHFVWLADRGGHSHLYLYKLDDDGATQVRALTSGDYSVNGIGAVGDGYVTFTARKDSHLEVHAYRVSLDGAKNGQQPQRLTPDEGTHFTSWSDDGRYFIDRHSSVSRAPRTDLRSADGKMVRTLVEPSTELADHFGFVTPELRTVPADDGFELPVSILKPKDFDPSRQYPAIVQVYGGPAAPRVRNSYSGSLATQFMLQEGFVLFTVDPRTSTAMGKPTTKALLKDFYSEREAADILAGVRWLKSQPYVDGDRVGITGWSGGGTTTVLAMTHSEEFRAGIAGAGVYDWHLYDTIYTERYMKHPRDNEAYDRPLTDAAEDLHGRLLLIHGSGDDNVHPQNTWRLVNELIDAGIVFDLMIYPMRKHGVGDSPGRLHLDKLRFDFWRRELMNQGP